MKSILLATASILAFAGAAAAEVTFGGSATLGYNLDDFDEDDDGQTDGCGFDAADPDEDGSDCEEGFFWEADLGVTLSQELNNGLTAAASFGLNITEDGTAGDEEITVDNNFLVSLTGEAGGLYFGDIDFAAESKWSGVTDMNADRFSEQDGEVVLRGEMMYMGIDAAVSYVVADDEGDTPEEGSDLDQLSIGAAATFGAFNMTMGYQEESETLNEVCGISSGLYDPQCSNDDFTTSSVFGVSAGTAFGGADVTVAYATDLTREDSSLGFEVAYPFGPVTLGAYYVMETDDASDYVAPDGSLDLGTEYEDTYGITAAYASGPITVDAFYSFDDNADGDDENDDDFGVEASYMVDDALTIYAGYIDSTEGYIGAEYDLGGGATAIVSYAEQDEEGAKEYEEGITVALNLAF